MPLLHEHGDVGVEAVEEQHGAEEQGEQVHRLRPEQLLEGPPPGARGRPGACRTPPLGSTKCANRKTGTTPKYTRKALPQCDSARKPTHRATSASPMKLKACLKPSARLRSPSSSQPWQHERVGQLHGMQQALPQPHRRRCTRTWRRWRGSGTRPRYHAPDEDDGQGELGNALLVHVGGQKAREQRPGDAHHGRHGEDHLDGGARHVGIGFAQHGQDGRERREDAVVNGEAEDGDQEQRALDPEITDEPAQRFSTIAPFASDAEAPIRALPPRRQTRPPSPAANRCDMIVWGPRFVLIPRGLIWPFRRLERKTYS